MPALFVAPGMGEVGLTPGNQLLVMQASGVGEAWFTLGITALSMSTGTTPHVSASFTMGTTGGDDYTLEVYCTTCGGKLLGRSANAPANGEDAENVNYYKGQTSPSGLTGDRLWVHVLPVQTSNCDQWNIVAITEAQTFGSNCGN
jgi:hypothetical protein